MTVNVIFRPSKRQLYVFLFWLNPFDLSRDAMDRPT